MRIWVHAAKNLCKHEKIQKYKEIQKNKNTNISIMSILRNIPILF